MSALVGVCAWAYVLCMCKCVLCVCVCVVTLPPAGLSGEPQLDLRAIKGTIPTMACSISPPVPSLSLSHTHTQAVSVCVMMRSIKLQQICSHCSTCCSSLHRRDPLQAGCCYCMHLCTDRIIVSFHSSAAIKVNGCHLLQSLIKHQVCELNTNQRFNKCES